MDIVKYDNSRTFFFVSGMFAGGWIWRNTYPKIPNANHWLMDEPLCNLGNSIDGISQKIIEEIERIPSPVTLVGNSLGSFICLDIARLLKTKIKSVIISGSAGFGEVTLPITLNRHDPEGVARKVVNLVCFDKSTISEEAHRKTTESFATNFRNIVSLIRESNNINVEQHLAEIHCPIHAIWGDNDVLTPFSKAVKILERFGVSSNIIKECGHSPMYEKPEEFASVLNQYMA